MQMQPLTPTPTPKAAQPERFRSVPEVVTPEVLSYYSDASRVCHAHLAACFELGEESSAKRLFAYAVEADRKYEEALARYCASL